MIELIAIEDLTKNYVHEYKACEIVKILEYEANHYQETDPRYLAPYHIVTLSTENGYISNVRIGGSYTTETKDEFLERFKAYVSQRTYANGVPVCYPTE